MKDLSIDFYLSDSAYMTALRLVAGAVCAAHDVDVDAMEDFKVCVTESAIILKNCGYEKITATFGGEGAGCTVEGVGGAPHSAENEFSLALVSALVGECRFEERDGIIKRVILKI